MALFIPNFRGAGSPGAPGVGSTIRGLQLVEQGKNTLAQQGLVAEQQKAAQPEALRQIEQAPQANDLTTQRNERQGQAERMVFTAQKLDTLKGNRQAQEEFLVNNIAEIDSRRGDSQHSKEGLRQLQEGLQTGDFTTFDQTIDSLKKIGDKSKKGLFSATTKQFGNGTVQQTAPDGSIRVTTPDGKEVSGEEAARVIKKARDEEVAFAGLKKKSEEVGKLDPVATQLAVDKQAALDFQDQKSKFQGSISQTVSKIGSAKATHSIMTDTADEIKSFISGLSAVYGASLKLIPGSEAKKLKGLLDTMKANSAFGTLIDLKESGGTLGAISSAELELLAAKLGSLDQSGEIPEMLRVLDQILTQNQGSIDRIETAFNSEKKRFRRFSDASEGDQAPQKEDGILKIDASGNKAMVFPDGTFEEVQ